jgi:presenilin-like A22 family membrane protease
MSFKKLLAFLGTGIIAGFLIGVILRELAFPGPSPPSSYDGFIGLGELSEKIAKLLLFVPAIIGGIIGLIAYRIKTSRTKKTRG